MIFSMKILAAAAIATVVRIHPGDTDGLNRCYDAAANNSSSDVVECQLQPGTLSVFLLKSSALVDSCLLLRLKNQRFCNAPNLFIKLNL